MAATGRSHGAALTARLFDEPWRFDFFQAVRLLERRTNGAAGPVGGDARPEHEVVRFRASSSLGFPAGEVVDLAPASRAEGADGPPGPPEMTVAFLGLTGQTGALPAHYSDLVLHRVRSRDTALRDFLDLLDHRTVSFLFRAWAKQCFAASYERAERGLEPYDRFTQALRSLVGRGTRGTRGRTAFRDDAVVRFAGHFSRRVPTAAGLESVLTAYFEQPVLVEQFTGEWLTLDAEERTRLPRGGHARGVHNRLGHDAMLGSRAFDVGGRFRLRVGPLTYREFREYLPGGERLRPFCEMVRCYVGLGLRFDVQPVLSGGEAPRCHLGVERPDAPRLGWNTWLGDASREDDFAGVTYGLEGV